MSRVHFLASLVILALAAGCKAQTTPQAPSDAALTRRIEVMVRSKFNIPPDYNLLLGPRKASQIPGYDSLDVMLVRNGKTTNIDFLISSDNTKLARLETFDLVKDPSLNIDVANRPVRGNPEAKVTIINFDDLECGYCARMHQTFFPDTVNHYKGLLKFVYKDFPLEEIHPWAVHAAVDANCLASQNGDIYWTYVDYLHQHGEEVNGADRDLKKSFAALDRIARQEGTVGKLDSAKLDACIAKQDETQVRTSAHEAETLGLEGTPAMFINGERIPGALPEDKLWLVIDRALRAAGVQPPPAQPETPAMAQKPAGSGK
ncbi:MAG TPA: thioredoxin domain-containing protein [Terracidiphilus sp.]